MENKKDWEELEQWQNKVKKESVEKYGIDFQTINTSKQNKIANKISLFLSQSSKIIFIFFIIFFIIVLIWAFAFAHSFFKKFNPNVNELEKNYNIKISVLSKEVDQNGNGKYLCTLKDNLELKFWVIKNYSKIEDDFYSKSLKFYFDRWHDIDKDKFIVQESYENELLDYKTYININDIKDIRYTFNIMYKFAEFCGDNFSRSWNIYICTDNFIGYFSDNYGLSQEENIKYMEENYLKYIEKNHLQNQ